MTLTGRQYIDWEQDFGESVALGTHVRIPPKFVGREILHNNHNGTVYRLEATPSDAWYDCHSGKYYSHRLWVGHKPVEFCNGIVEGNHMMATLIKNQEPIDPYADLKEVALF